MRRRTAPKALPRDPTATEAPAGYLQLAVLGRTFQLEGALRLRIRDEFADGDEQSLAAFVISEAQQLFVTSLGRVRVRELRFPAQGTPLLLLEGVRDRNAAQALVNQTVWVDPDWLSAELAQELRDSAAAGDDAQQLSGRPVLQDGVLIGEIVQARLDSPNPVVEVQLTSGAVVLVPLVANYVELSSEALLLTDPPPGLVDAS